jgi:hypothetical protein
LKAYAKMFFHMNQNELFELLQSENFIIGKSLFNKTISLEEIVTNRQIEEKKKYRKNYWQISKHLKINVKS